MHKIIKESLIKNIILVVVLVLLYPSVRSFLINSNLILDSTSMGSMIVVASIISVIACFGNFEFTYEKINIKKIFQRYLAHAITGLFMLVLGISLVFISVLTRMIMGYFVVIDITLMLLYLACVIYDFWDVYRISR